MIRLLGLFLFISGLSFTQVDLKLKDSTMVDFSSFRVDQLGGVLVFDQDSLVKLDSEGKRMYTFDYSNLGAIEDVVCLNSLKKFVFDKQNQKILFLDNTLTIQKEVMIPGDFGFVTAVYWSTDGKFWLYDSAQNRILICNQNFDLITDTGNMELIYGFPQSYKVKFIQSGTNITIYSEKQKQLVLDNNGAYVHLLSMKGEHFNHRNEVYVSSENTQLVFESKLNKKSIETHRKIDDLTIFKDKIYLLSNNYLYIYIIQ